MEIDLRSRTWIVTFEVEGIDTINDTDVLGNGTLKYTMAHAKMSKVKGTCSIWLTFEHAQRASTLSRSFEHTDNLVLKRVSQRSYEEFKSLESDREFTMTGPLCHGTVESTNATMEAAAQQPGSTTDPFTTINIESAKASKIRKRISQLNEELGECVKRLRNAVAKAG